MIIRDNFLLILHKTYVVTPHLNCHDKPVQMRGYNMVLMRNKINYPSITIKYSSYLELCN